MRRRVSGNVQFATASSSMHAVSLLMTMFDIYKGIDNCFFRNVLCGMLHCKHLNERLEFGMESVAILSHSFINLKGLIVPCRTAIVDLGINQVDPGLAPDGAKCGEGKVSYPYV